MNFVGFLNFLTICSDNSEPKKLAELLPSTIGRYLGNFTTILAQITSRLTAYVIHGAALYASW